MQEAPERLRVLFPTYQGLRSTEQWAVAPGETASFPTKWMSADGRTLHLVFSGDDHFSVRKATLTASGNK